MQTKLFRQQHGEIFHTLATIDRLRNDGTEESLCGELSRLAGVVKMHLTLEDNNLYPMMLKHADPKVRATAEEYKRTMGGLASAYLAFHEKWIRAQAITSDRPGFVRDFEQIRNALKSRLDMEDRNLYDLVDANF